MTAMVWKLLILSVILQSFSRCDNIQKNSLAFVIDNTSSMRNVISSVKSNANAIFDTVMSTESSQVENFVLVTFNDPGVRTRTNTTKKSNFKQALRDIEVYGGGKCPEYSMSGIKRALEVSLPRSNLFVFTDASAEDFRMYEEVKSLAQKKSAQIDFILTGRCDYAVELPDYLVYFDLANATSGQVFKSWQSGIQEILDYVKDVVKGPMSELTKEDFPPGKHNIYYPVDQFTGDIHISVSGTWPKVSVTDPDGLNVPTHSIVAKPENTVMKVPTTKTGTHTATISSTSKTHCVVKGRTTIDFQHGFSETRRTTLTGTTTKPQPDASSYLLIDLNIIKGEEVKLNTVQLLNLDGKVLQEHTLTEIDAREHIYVTAPFEPPMQEFRIKVSGKVISSNKPVERLTSTTIEPESTKPRIVLDNGKTEYTALSRDVVLRIPCKSTGYPKPTITWRVDGRVIATDSKYAFEEGSLVISSPNVHDNRDYTCTATNRLGHDTKTFQGRVEARPQIVLDHNKTKYTALTQDVVFKIPCYALGYPKPILTWKVDGEPISPGVKYSFREDALIIQSPLVNGTHKYTCTARNKLGEDTKTFQGTVEDDFSAYDNVHELHGIKDKPFDIKCLLPHSETDTVTWFYNTDVMNDIPPHTYTLRLNDTSVSKSGNYSCRVTNQNGYQMDTYEVVFGYPPSFSAYQESEFNWNGVGTMDCEVDALPQAKIRWYYEGKPVNTADELKKMDITAWGQYTCKATNLHGSVQRHFNVSSRDCLIHKREEKLDRRLPVILSESRSWLDIGTDNDVLVTSKDSQVILSCQNEDSIPNSFKMLPGANEIVASCVYEDKFLVNGKTYRYSDLECTHANNPVVKHTGEQCLNKDTEIIQVGYQLKEFVEVYRVCFDIKNKRPLYTRQISLTSENKIAHSVPSWYKYPEFEPRTPNLNTCGKPSSDCCVGEEQLVNAEDVAFGAAQRSTFIKNINTVASWRSCNQSRTDWARIHDIIINSDKIAVWSGASEYTDQGVAVVPRYLWKVVKRDEDNVNAIIYVNEEEPKNSHVLCKNVCAPQSDYWLEIKDKYTYCCHLDDFVAAFNLSEDIFKL